MSASSANIPVSSSSPLSTSMTPSSLLPPPSNNYRNVLAMMNIEKFVQENAADIRHQKLLQNIVKILKINDLLEEYRGVVRNLQTNCACKKAKSVWDHVGQLEGRYKELIVESCRANGNEAALSLASLATNGSITIPKGNPSSKTNGAKASSSSSSPSTPTVVTAIPAGNSTPTTSANVLNFSIFNSISSASGNSNATNNNGHLEDIKPNINKISSHINGTTSPCSTLGAISTNGSTTTNNSHTIELVVDKAAAALTAAQQAQLQQDNDDINLIEEEDILEDEEDDAEEELDIEEYMALSEILEKESDSNRFQKEDDPKNEFILVIRDTTTGEIICYECVVGGTCGFLSRERTRMLLHIAKHFAAEDDEHEEEEDGEEDVTDEEDVMLDEMGEEIELARRHSGASNKDIDISIIPLNPDGTLNVTASGSGQKKRRKKNRNGSLMDEASSQKAQLLQLQQQQAAGNHKIISKPGEKPIHCEWDNCTFQCDQNYKLRTHIRQVHEKVRPYLCDWPGCFGAYKTRSNLASHRMVHTGERPFICDYPKCGAKFARKYDCERHRRIHSEKMFACEWPGCGKRLCDPYNLERHMMVHKGELPFRCPIGKCIRGFRELRYLRDHMVNTHKFLPDTNQLRIACLNSSKVSSISGYNLNESSSDGSNHADMSAYVNAIMPPSTPSSRAQKRSNSTNSLKNESDLEFSITASSTPDSNNNSITITKNTASTSNSKSRRKQQLPPSQNGFEEEAVVIEVEGPQSRRSKRIRK